MGERVRWGKKGREVESERGGRIEKEILRQRGGSSASAYGFESMNQSRILHAYYVITHLSNQHKDTQRHTTHKDTQRNTKLSGGYAKPYADQDVQQSPSPKRRTSLVALQSGLITDLIIDHKQGPCTDHSI